MHRQAAHPQVQLLPQFDDLRSVQAAQLFVLVVEVLLEWWIVNLPQERKHIQEATSLTVTQHGLWPGRTLADLAVVNGRQRHDDLFGGGSDGVAVAVVLNVVLLLLLAQPRSGVLRHVAKVGFLSESTVGAPSHTHRLVQNTASAAPPADTQQQQLTIRRMGGGQIGLQLMSHYVVDKTIH